MRCACQGGEATRAAAVDAAEIALAAAAAAVAAAVGIEQQASVEGACERCGEVGGGTTRLAALSECVMRHLRLCALRAVVAREYGV